MWRRAWDRYRFGWFQRDCTFQRGRLFPVNVVEKFHENIPTGSENQQRVQEEPDIGGLNTISVEAEFRANVNLATGSVSTRLPECAGPHCGMIGTMIAGVDDSVLSSFRLVGDIPESVPSADVKKSSTSSSFETVDSK